MKTLEFQDILQNFLRKFQDSKETFIINEIKLFYHTNCKIFQRFALAPVIHIQRKIVNIFQMCTKQKK